jgi:hypothetical protein
MAEGAWGHQENVGLGGQQERIPRSGDGVVEEEGIWNLGKCNAHHGLKCSMWSNHTLSSLYKKNPMFNPNTKVKQNV